MQDYTRKRLELLVTKGKQVAQWNYVKHYRQQGIQTNIQMGWNAEKGFWLTENNNAPNDEAITSIAAILRFFTQKNEHICLFSDSWIMPRPPHRPDWLNDPYIFSAWHEHWGGVQQHISNMLSSHTRPTKLIIFDETVTFGMVYEVAMYGSYVHSTQADKFNQWMSIPPIKPFIMDSLYLALGAIIDGIGKITTVTELELAGQPLPPWNSLVNTKIPRRRRRPLLNKMAETRPF